MTADRKSAKLTVCADKQKLVIKDISDGHPIKSFHDDLLAHKSTKYLVN